MTPNKVIEIFAAATAAYKSVTSKPAFTDIDQFDNKVNSILVEITRDYDRDEYGMLYLNQDPNKYSFITGGLTLSKIGALAVYNTSIGSTTSDAERKKAEVLWKVKLNKNC